MNKHDYCCSADGHGLSYPGFSVVFIQTFSIHHTLRFCVENRFMDNPLNLRAFDMKLPMVYRNQSIENQIFIRSSAPKPFEAMKKMPYKDGFHKIVEGKVISGKPYKDVQLFPEDSVYRFALRGFNFELPVESEDDSDEMKILSGHVSVEMSLFFGHTVSLTYRFLFDGNAAGVYDAESGNPVSAKTDDIIALLSTHLGAEFWSKEKVQLSDAPSQTDINLETEMRINDFWFEDDGTPRYDSPRDNMILQGKGRTFDGISTIYKNFIYRECTAVTNDPGLKDEAEKYIRKKKGNIQDVRNDFHYAMVDIWENVQHVDENGVDLFKKMPNNIGGLSEAEVVNHIREYHKPELIGLMTLYPGEWRYRDAEAYEEVCGENIAIDTDDLVLVGSNLSVVIGTYGRRGSAEGADAAGVGVDWTEHLQERAKYHVSWPEYLMILQMVIAKKYRIGLAKNRMVDVTLDVQNQSAEELIGNNAELSMRLSRMILQLDAVKYSKFASHKVMFDRTTRRLGLEHDIEELREIISMVDDSLQNLSDFKSMKSEFFLNIILAIISVASTFELLFQNSEMPFLSYFGIPNVGLAAWLVAVVASVTVFALLLVLKNSLVKLWNMYKND